MASTDRPPPRGANDAASEPASGIGHRPAEEAPDKTLRVLQLTDLHLYAEPERRLLDQNTRSSFNQVLARAQAAQWPPDAILFTGDLVHDERPEGYRYLRQRIDSLGCRCFCIPGNHDSPELLASEVEPGADRHFRVERLGAWDLLLLDSTVRGSEAGHLRPQTLAALERHLDSRAKLAPRRPALIALHHQPLPVGSRWLDTMQVDNGAELIALAERCAQAKVIIWGHIHQVFDRQLDTTRLLATPSTCAQFTPSSDDFAQDSLPAGYRWLELEPDGSLRTGVERLAADETKLSG